MHLSQFSVHHGASEVSACITKKIDMECKKYIHLPDDMPKDFSIVRLY